MTKIDYKNSKNIIYAKYYNRLYDLIHMKPNHSKTLIKELKKELKESLKKAIVRIKDNTRENEVIDTLNELKRKRIKLLTKYKEQEENNKKKLLFVIKQAQNKKKEKNYESRYTFTTRNELEKN